MFNSNPVANFSASFTCNSCKPGGRGPRCAAWFLEHVRNVAGDNDIQVMSLEGGLKGWVEAGPEYTQLMDGFREEAWSLPPSTGQTSGQTAL